MTNELRIYEIFDNNGAAWDKFMANEEWAAIKRETAAEHGSVVGEIEGRILRPVDYSAALSAT